MDPVLLLASLLRQFMEFQLIQAKAEAEGRKLSVEEIDAIRNKLLESDIELEQEIVRSRHVSVG